jgi:hypothetical protein
LVDALYDIGVVSRKAEATYQDWGDPVTKPENYNTWATTTIGVLETT